MIYYYDVLVSYLEAIIMYTGIHGAIVPLVIGCILILVGSYYWFWRILQEGVTITQAQFELDKRECLKKGEDDNYE